MNTTLVRAVSAGLFFLFIFLSGFWLSRSGKPYSSLILNVHKLIALAAVVFLVMTVIRMNQAGKMSTAEVIASVITGLLFLIAIISGGLASIDKSWPAAITTVHHILPYVIVLSTAATLYLLLYRT